MNMCQSGGFDLFLSLYYTHSLSTVKARMGEDDSVVEQEEKSYRVRGERFLWS